MDKAAIEKRVLEEDLNELEREKVMLEYELDNAGAKGPMQPIVKCIARRRVSRTKAHAQRWHGGGSVSGPVARGRFGT